MLPLGLLSREQILLYKKIKMVTLIDQEYQDSCYHLIQKIKTLTTIVQDN